MSMNECVKDKLITWTLGVFFLSEIVGFGAVYSWLAQKFVGSKFAVLVAVVYSVFWLFLMVLGKAVSED